MTFSQPRYPFNSARKVWLTFDDGPHPEYTDRVLDVLQLYGIKATFFVLGASVDRYGTAILKRMGTEGHSIGNHAYSHTDLTSLTESEVRDEIKSTEELIGHLVNAEKLFRPPYGATSRMVDGVVRKLNYRKVLWNVDTRDWDPACQPNHWVERALYLVRRRKRAVVIAHDIHKTTADHIAELIERIGPAIFKRCRSRKHAS
jgi:peptidoglycan/xylan/chitin deacetylase (PgdA/CDA1 family)